MTRYFLGIDLGTSGVKAALFDSVGVLIDSESKSYPLFCSDGGYAEQNPIDWQKATLACIKAIFLKHTDKEIAGIGVGGQMHGLVLLDKDDKVLRNSIIWCDTRAQKECDSIIKIMPNYADYSINPPIVGFTLPKLLWVKNHEPEIFSKINKILLPKDYINFCLCGEYSGDVSDASGTGFFDIEKRRWSDEILRAFEIKKEWLPKVYESCEVVGNLALNLCAELNIQYRPIVVAGAGDQAAAALGNGIVGDNEISVCLGTSGVVFSATKNPKKDVKGRVHTFCHAVPNLWHVMGVTQGCCLSVDWFKNNFAKDLSFKDLDNTAFNIGNKQDSPIFLPYLMGERTPHLDSEIRGAFIGISANHTTFDMYRAVLEGVCFSLKNCLDILTEMDISVNEIKVSGGGAKSHCWTSILADILDKKLYINSQNESGVLGVSMLAMVGAKEYPSLQTCLNNLNCQSGREVSPNSNAQYAKKYKSYNNAYFAIKSI